MNASDGSLTPICATDWELYVMKPSAHNSFAREAREDLTARIQGVPSLKVVTPPFGDVVVPIVTEPRRRGMKNPRNYVPPVLVPTMVNLRRRFRDVSKRTPRSRA